MNLFNHKMMLLVIHSLFTYSQVTFAQNEPPIKVDFSAWETYAKNVESCQRGSFVLPNPMIIGMIEMGLSELQKEKKELTPEQSQKMYEVIKSASITYIIKGWENNKCQISIKQKNAPDFNCSFSKEDLKSVKYSAQQIASGSFKLSTEDPISKLMMRNCKYK